MRVGAEGPGHFLTAAPTHGASAWKEAASLPPTRAAMRKAEYRRLSEAEGLLQTWAPRHCTDSREREPGLYQEALCQ